MKHYIFSAIVLFVLFMAGCKKEQVERKSECRVVKITEPGSFTEIFSYDGRGRLLTVNHSGSITSFIYQGDSIIKQGVWKSVYKLNNQGLLASERRTYDNDEAEWETRDYQYNGVQLQKVMVNSYTGNGNTRTYTWSKGNMVSEDITGATYSQHIEYEYYTDKPYGAGDIQYQDLLDNGVEAIRNKNLTRKYKSTYTDSYGTEETELNYSYEFDGDERIISMTVTELNNSHPSIYSYEYQCQ